MIPSRSDDNNIWCFPSRSNKWISSSLHHGFYSLSFCIVAVSHREERPSGRRCAARYPWRVSPPSDDPPTSPPFKSRSISSEEAVVPRDAATATTYCFPCAASPRLPSPLGHSHFVFSYSNARTLMAAWPRSAPCLALPILGYPSHQ